MKAESNQRFHYRPCRRQALIQKMSECKSPEEIYALVKDRRHAFEQFAAEMTIANSYLQEMESGLLDEDDLDAVAGGKSGKQKVKLETA